MKLLTKAIIKRFEKVGSQEEVSDPIVITKYFNPAGRGTWWATEYDPTDQTFFGYVSIFGDHCDEWGRFSLDELESVKLPWGLKIERDLYFNEQPISKFINKEG